LPRLERMPSLFDGLLGMRLSFIRTSADERWHEVILPNIVSKNYGQNGSSGVLKNGWLLVRTTGFVSILIVIEHTSVPKMTKK